MENLIFFLRKIYAEEWKINLFWRIQPKSFVNFCSIQYIVNEVKKIEIFENRLFTQMSFIRYWEEDETMRSFQNYASITDSFFSKIVNLPNNQKNSTGTQTMQLRKLGDKKKEIRYLRPSQLQSGFQEIRKSANINSAFLGHGRSRKIQEAEEKVSRGFMMETEMRRGQEGIIRLNPRS